MYTVMTCYLYAIRVNTEQKPPTELQEGDNFSGDENSSSDDDNDDDDSDGEI
jgi:hypothetical protein